MFASDDTSRPDGRLRARGEPGLRVLTVASRLLLAIGMLLVLLAVAFGVSRAGFLSGAERTTGTVVAVQERLDDRVSSRRVTPQSTFAPVVTFRDAGGRSHRFTSATGFYPPRHHVGDEVDVLFERDDPAGATLADFWSLWLVPMVFGVLGIALLGAAMVFRLLRRSAPASWSTPTAIAARPRGS